MFSLWRRLMTSVSCSLLLFKHTWTSEVIFREVKQEKRHGMKSVNQICFTLIHITTFYECSHMTGPSWFMTSKSWLGTWLVTCLPWIVTCLSWFVTWLLTCLPFFWVTSTVRLWNLKFKIFQMTNLFHCDPYCNTVHDKCSVWYDSYVDKDDLWCIQEHFLKGCRSHTNRRSPLHGWMSNRFLCDLWHGDTVHPAPSKLYYKVIHCLTRERVNILTVYTYSNWPHPMRHWWSMWFMLMNNVCLHKHSAATELLCFCWNFLLSKLFLSHSCWNSCRMYV